MLSSGSYGSFIPLEELLLSYVERQLPSVAVLTLHDNRQKHKVLRSFRHKMNNSSVLSDDFGELRSSIGIPTEGP
jgi:hypothetical protein